MAFNAERSCRGPAAQPVYRRLNQQFAPELSKRLAVVQSKGFFDGVAFHAHYRRDGPEPPPRILFKGSYGLLEHALQVVGNRRTTLIKR